MSQKVDDLKYFDNRTRIFPRSHPSTSNNDENNYNSDKPTADLERKSEISHKTESNSYKSHKDEENMMIVESDHPGNSREASKVFHGILFIENLKNMKEIGPTNYFVNYEGFWNYCTESTDVCSNYVFNYLKVINKFLK